ncbi:uncharacterized protein [Miscanthus floridulus]|uniref:uncharacterized protein n=1 Tax=Miscanthus floridulus TaxID=154761 RepID=UPI0034594614
MVMLQSAIRNAGYQVSGSYVDPLALKTDAPMSVIWDIMRCWIKLRPVKHRPGNHPGNEATWYFPKSLNCRRIPGCCFKRQVYQAWAYAYYELGSLMGKAPPGGSPLSSEKEGQTVCKYILHVEEGMKQEIFIRNVSASLSVGFLCHKFERASAVYRLKQVNINLSNLQNSVIS